MKHLKKFENYKETGYEGKLFISKPSNNYFKSDIQFQIIFVDTVIPHIHDYDVSEYEVKGQDVIQFSRSVNTGEESFNYVTKWDQAYSEDEFRRIDFMTAEEFYKKYKSSYIRILNELLDKLEDFRNGSLFNKKLDRLIEKLTIPEVEHIIDIRKYNL